MNKYVGFLRAVNVGGHATVRMKDLEGALSAAGCEGVSTYGHAGNVIFTCSKRQAPATFRDIRRTLGVLLGGAPTVVIRTIDELDALVRAKPFNAVRARDAKLYVTFLSHGASEETVTSAGVVEGSARSCGHEEPRRPHRQPAQKERVLWVSE